MISVFEPVVTPFFECVSVFVFTIDPSGRVSFVCDEELVS
jgi:hypothetical protein